MQTTINLSADWMRDENTLREFAQSLAAAAYQIGDDGEAHVINPAAEMALQIVHEVMLPATKKVRGFLPSEFHPPKGDIEGRVWAWAIGEGDPILVPAASVRRVPGVYWMHTGLEQATTPEIAPATGNA